MLGLILVIERRLLQKMAHIRSHSKEPQSIRLILNPYKKDKVHQRIRMIPSTIIASEKDNPGVNVGGHTSKDGQKSNAPKQGEMI